LHERYVICIGRITERYILRGDPAVIGFAFRPEALRPRLSASLPFTLGLILVESDQWSQALLSLRHDWYRRYL